MKILKYFFLLLLLWTSAFAQQQTTTIKFTPSASPPSAPSSPSVGVMYVDATGHPAFVPTTAFAANLVWASPSSGTGSVVMRALVASDLPAGFGVPAGSTGDIQTNGGSSAFGSFTPGSGVVTFLTIPSSANLAAAVTNETGTGALVFATNATLVTPILGTPQSVTLTNGTGLPQAGTVGLTTADSPQFAGINLGNASDTTLSRVSAGVMAVEGVTVPTVSSTNSLTNKSVKPQITTISSSATPTVNTDTTDFVTITAQAAAITSMTTNLSGTPTNGQRLAYRIKDSGSAQTIAWGASFATRVATLPTTTTSGKVTGVVFWWNSVTSTWDCMAAGTES